MSKRRIMKMMTAFLCILSIMMPYMTPVFAKALTHEDTVINLETVEHHEGGDEETGTLPDEYIGFYDVNKYRYEIGDKTVFKVIVSGDGEFENALYCLNGDKSFPGTVALEYKNMADLKNDIDPNVKKLGLSAANYKSLIWLINNMYLRKQTPEQKDEFLAKAFNVEIGSDDFYTIKTLLTDDDIEVVQQWAMWNFTNSENPKYTSFGAVTLIDRLNGNNTGSYGDVTGRQERQDYARDLYNYLVKSAKEAKDVESVRFPNIAKTELKSDVDGAYYKVGPFKVVSGTASSESYKLRLLDSNDVEIPRENYNIKIDGENEFSNANVGQIFDKNYYIYIPIKDNKITKLKLSLDYSTYETEATLWETQEAKYQPMALITREKTPHNEVAGINIEQKQYDLALRKYIVKVNNTEYTNRNPNVDVTPLKNGEETAIYRHPKAPIEVNVGDKVIYEIRVYNEGDINAELTKIIDYLPEGLELVENSEINQRYGWYEENNREIVSNYFENKVLNAFDKNTDTLDSKAIQIECKVLDNVDAGKILTNIAEIKEDKIDDRDSVPGSIEIDKIDTETFSGDRNNDTDLTKNEYYKGLEDDDDFEKVKVKGGFDLSLKKFITKANGIAPVTDRTPEVDVTPLKNASKTDANYKTIKTPIVVKKGDVIIYTIRVYNEGEIAGYAEEIADYLPQGLGFLVNHTINVDNYWSIAEMSESKNLSQIPNGKDNLKIEDFTGVDKLDDVKVVVGKVKLLSTKLKSSNTDTENLIKAFDKANGTKLDYKDIQIACIVLDDIPQGNSLRNVAEITKNSNENKEDVKDIDSVPNTVNPDNYPGDDKNQDDNDYELLVPEVPKKFDLALQKFITKLNDNNITDRVPKVSIQNGKISYEHKETSLPVANGDLVTYTIRIYNEGEADGYAAEVGDDLPEGLTYVVDNETNKQYGWKLYDKNGRETSDVKQAVSVKTDYLSKVKSEGRNENCLIKAFSNTGITATNPDYRDVRLVLKVETNPSNKNDLINTAEITDDTDKDGNPVDDIDSVPGNNKKDEDDIDEEKVRLQEFDLSLQKFITKVNSTEIKDRMPTITKNQDGSLRFNHSTEALKVANNDVVTYTIRVYNEGDVPGYAKEVSDDLPKGLTFITDNETNKKYEWKLYDENGKETSDLAKAKTVKTDYLSKEKASSRREDCLLKAYDAKADISNTNPDYKDLQIVFRVNEADIGKDKSKREIINTAEITDDTDKDGNPVDDRDSTPGNNKDGEDDLDREKVCVKYFDLSLQKDLVKAIIVEDGKTREVSATQNQLLKIEINRKKIDKTTVKFVYNITVKNEGEIAGYATELKDYIPDGLEFIQEDNTHWKKESDKVVTTEALKDTLLEPGKTATTQITLKWTNAENNMGEKVNIAEISKDKNDSNSPDIDSTPNNKVMTEDDIDTAPVVLSISTGTEQTIYVILPITVLVILAVGITLIKKYVLISM